MPLPLGFSPAGVFHNTLPFDPRVLTPLSPNWCSSVTPLHVGPLTQFSNYPFFPPFFFQLGPYPPSPIPLPKFPNVPKTPPLKGFWNPPSQYPQDSQWPPIKAPIETSPVVSNPPSPLKYPLQRSPNWSISLNRKRKR